MAIHSHSLPRVAENLRPSIGAFVIYFFSTVEPKRIFAAINDLRL